MRFIALTSILLGTLAITNYAKPAIAQNVNCNNQRNNMEMTICAGREFEAADRELNRVYQRLVNFRPNKSPIIRDAQRAWIVYRDKECAITAAAWEGGSGQSMAVSICKTELTRERIRHLRNHLENQG